MRVSHYKIVCSNCQNVVAECACPTKHEKKTTHVEGCTKCFEDVTFSQIYPEHAKLEKVKNESQVIGEFLTEMQDKGVFLCRQSFGEMVPHGKLVEEVLAEYFKVDLNKLEKEKQHMLKEQRALNEKVSG